MSNRLTDVQAQEILRGLHQPSSDSSAKTRRITGGRNTNWLTEFDGRKIIVQFPVSLEQHQANLQKKGNYPYPYYPRPHHELTPQADILQAFDKHSWSPDLLYRGAGYYIREYMDGTILGNYLAQPWADIPHWEEILRRNLPAVLHDRSRTPWPGQEPHGWPRNIAEFLAMRVAMGERELEFWRSKTGSLLKEFGIPEDPYRRFHGNNHRSHGGDWGVAHNDFHAFQIGAKSPASRESELFVIDEEYATPGTSKSDLGTFIVQTNLENTNEKLAGDLIDSIAEGPAAHSWMEDFIGVHALRKAVLEVAVAARGWRAQAFLEGRTGNRELETSINERSAFLERVLGSAGRRLNISTDRERLKELFHDHIARDRVFELTVSAREGLGPVSSAVHMANHPQSSLSDSIAHPTPLARRADMKPTRDVGLNLAATKQVGR